MKVVILCGGQGTRIREVADDIPKPMIAIGDYPILWHIMKSYAQYGFNDFILCLGYKGTIIKDFFVNYKTNISDLTLSLGDNNSVKYHNAIEESDWKVTLANTGVSAMTGARIKRIESFVGNDEDFLLTYGDGLGDVDYDALVHFHKRHKRILTLTGVRPPGRFGELEADEVGRVLEFNEKPQAGGGRISGGFFVCRRELFGYLDERDDLVFEQEPMRQLVGEGELMVFQHDGFWQCMDTPRDHRLLTSLWKTDSAPWKVW